jgi:hypothetical protein
MKSGRLRELYVSASLILVNAFLLLLVLNSLAAVYLSIGGRLSNDNPVAAKYSAEALRAAYPNLQQEQIDDLLHETWSRGFIYQPFTQFSEAPFRGRYVNVSKIGYREGHDQANWPPPPADTNILVFGGSTTFGYGVEDDQTIAAHLQDRLRRRLDDGVNVYNFGRGFYYSTQERILFQQLLMAGVRPDVAVFIDGLNDFYHYDDRPLYTDRFADYVGGNTPKVSRLAKLPVARLFRQVAGDDKAGNIMPADQAGPAFDDSKVLDGVISRYLENRRMIEAVAASYNVKTLFVWQPVPTYKYDTSYHPFFGNSDDRHGYSVFGYPRFRQLLDGMPPADNFLWAADIQQDLAEALYVDQVHYTGEFSDRIAGMVADKLLSGVMQ